MRLTVRSAPARGVAARISRATLLAAFLVAGADGCASPSAAQAPSPAVPPAAGQEQAFRGPQSFADLARDRLPAVVNVSATQRPDPSARPGPGIPGMPGLQLPPGSPLEDFFRRFAPPDMEERPSNALGSGFVIDPEGYIVTNNHVVEQADEVKVILHDDTELPAEIIGRDPLTDLALLKVKTDRRLLSVAWGDSDRAQVGDWVLAIGNPFGLGGTVTSGIISARARQINAGPYDDFLQTDASINRGNSGGPLFDMQGQVIGVTTAIFSPSGGSVGIGFAIPSAIAQDVIRDLREKGEVVRGYLGVSIQPVTPDIAEALGLQETQGALVAQVVPDSPAAAAGIRPGDVILGFDGREIREPRVLSRTVAATEVGSRRVLEVLRDGRRMTVTTEIARLAPPEEMAAAGVPPGASPEPPGPMGLELSLLDPALRRDFGLDPETEGVVVTGVAPDSVAAEQGFQPGDLIRSVGGEQVSSPADVRRAVDKARQEGRNSILILRERDGNALFAAIPLQPRNGLGGRG